MTQAEARELAASVRDALPMQLRQQLKAIHIAPKLHNGMLTIRVHMVPVTAGDPEPYIFTAQEL